MTKRARVCPHIDRHGKSCPHILPCPVPEHAPRPANASWSSDRDKAQHGRFAKAVLARDGYKCVRCGSTWKIQAHHVKPGYDVSCGVTLCGRCHPKVDSNAR